jgi:hypothetical protein
MSHDTNNHEPVMTGARQTMSTWSKRIESYDAIPVVYRSALDPQLAETADFPHIVLIPPLDKFLRKTNQKLICDSPEAIHILERSGSQVVKKCYPYQGITMLEYGSILLRSWIKICGPTSEGDMDSSAFDFNTVMSERHFSLFVSKARPVPTGDDESGFKTEQDKFKAFVNLNFKFMNYGRSSLIMGQKVRQTLLQPEIRGVSYKFFGWTFYRTLALATLTILTGQELIFIQDDDRGLKKGAKNGGVWQYIPLRAIASTSLQESAEDLLTLTVNLTSGHTLNKSFEAHNKEELELLRKQLEG